MRLIDARKNRERTSREYRKRYEQGDKAAVIELLQRDIRFINERWVKEAWLRRSGKRGNRWGNTTVDRLVILGMVDSLTEKGDETWKERKVWVASMCSNVITAADLFAYHDRGNSAGMKMRREKLTVIPAISQEARRRGIYELYGTAYCPDCGRVSNIILIEFATPVKEPGSV